MSRQRLEGELMMSGRERAEYGVTITFENNTGRRLTLSRVGKVREAIRSACDDAVRLDETFRVICVSTPPLALRRSRRPPSTPTRQQRPTARTVHA